MPRLEFAIPETTAKTLQRRIARSQRLMHWLQQTEPAQMAMQLRRENLALRQLFHGCVAIGPAAADQAAGLYRCMIAARAMMLDVIAYPKRPGRAAVNDRILRALEAAVPEIVVPEAPSQEPDSPPSV